MTMSLSIFGDVGVDNKALSSGLVNNGGVGAVHWPQKDSLHSSEDSSDSWGLFLDFPLEAAGCPELAAWDFLNAQAAATAGYFLRCSQVCWR